MQWFLFLKGFFFKYPKVPQPRAFFRKWQVPHPMETIEVEHSREIWSKTTAWAGNGAYVKTSAKSTKLRPLPRYPRVTSVPNSFGYQDTGISTSSTLQQVSTESRSTQTPNHILCSTSKDVDTLLMNECHSASQEAHQNLDTW